MPLRFPERAGSTVRQTTGSPERRPTQTGHRRPSAGLISLLHYLCINSKSCDFTCTTPKADQRPDYLRIKGWISLFSRNSQWYFDAKAHPRFGTTRFLCSSKIGKKKLCTDNCGISDFFLWHFIFLTQSPRERCKS